MVWEIKVEQSMADGFVDQLLDKKRIKPSRREALGPSIKNVAEAVSLGYVSINDDGSIKQTLIEPIGTLTEINYKARIEPSVINGKLAMLKGETYGSRLMVYTQAYTGLLAAQVNSLEPCDKETCEAISTFFL